MMKNKGRDRCPVIASLKNQNTEYVSQETELIFTAGT